MGKGFIDKVYELAPNYTVKMEVSYTTTRLELKSTKNPKLVKTSIFRLSDLPSNQNLDEFCTQELDRLLAVIQSEE